MMIITTDNIVEYVLKNTELFTTRQLCVEDISDFNPQEEKEGFVNYIYRVYNHEKSVIVKQARPYLKYFGESYTLTPLRNLLEHETLKLRGGIVPQYTPKTFFIDKENNIFIMEDLSYLKVMRFQLNKMMYFPKFSKQIGEYLAKSNFYTSELYLDAETHRLLQASFINADMRSIMENAAFIRGAFAEIDYNTPNKRLLNVSERVWSKEEIILECYKMRDIFMKRGECLIHGDLHTSNIFIDCDRMKIIDMEYTFMGPYSFDMGYLIANFVSQFSAFTFKSNIGEEQKENYCCYLLNTIKEMYEYYVHYFNECWEKDLKEEYRSVKGYKESILDTFLSEVIGFAACANMIRLISLAGYPDYDVMEEMADKCNAQGLSIVIDQFMLLNRSKIKSIDELIHIILDIRKDYIKNTLLK
ncbi:S-methyl-5-thioribose kinase [Geosporobacter ferrireducens]|uniref:S-methyl-5-thioribose kinase n=1 Tax=Geosporobacter ferrireducens TaxID=1424294 RepID=A0A1D8GIR2_9FIRM|nr:S-methyl-5-thioribose kinase [Geosporobacter ferrireducens]AOT70781.1 S-methyl-5-thioribose kinase [Geosporobacter ferrireducens]